MIYMYSRRDLCHYDNILVEIDMMCHDSRRDYYDACMILVEILPHPYKNCKSCVGFCTWRGAGT